MDEADLEGKIQRTKAQIRQAFARVPRPEKDRLLDPGLWAGEVKALRDFQRGGWAHWWDVPQEVLERHTDALHAFSPEAFRFYLPAYLTFALDRPDSGSGSVDMTIGVLDSGVKPAELRAFRTRFGDLDDEQRRAITAFLILWRDQLGSELDATQARIALERHWEAEEDRSVPEDRAVQPEERR